MKTREFDPPAPIVYRPIGIARTPFLEKRSAPRQASVAEGSRGQIELYPESGFEHALEDLDRWQRIILLFHFHLAVGFKPKVLPPRSEVARGLFSTRSPHRPNAIGLSVVRLERVVGLTVHVAELDLVDGTPILDIKPYVPYADAFPEAGSGWLAPVDPVAAYVVTYAAEARAQLGWLRAEGVNLQPEIEAVLVLGPDPKPYRRIRRQKDGKLVLALKAFRIDFEAREGRCIEVLRIRTGYRDKELHEDASLSLHRELATRAWP
jgi:tRNA (adenine37-N6)-methyltransferase